MAVDVVMPAMEMAQETATLLRWLKAEGELVRQGEPLMEIETDKITVEVEAPATGVLAHVTANPDDEVPVGEVVAVVLEPGEAPPSPPRDDAEPAPDRKVAPPASSPSRGSSQPDTVAASDAPARLAPASPKARRLAAEQGLDVGTIAGSGSAGEVLVGDVLKVVTGRADSASEHRRPAATDAFTVVPLTGARKTAAERLQASSQTAPHISLTVSADVTETLRLLERLRPAVAEQTGQPPTITAFLAHVVGQCLSKHPHLNAHVLGDEIHVYPAVHLGIAVALEEGLIVPVIRDIGKKTLAEIQLSIAELASSAKVGALEPRHVKGSTFTLTNLGMFGVEQFTAILNPPEAGILAVGAIRDVPSGVNGEIVLRPTIALTLCADHRAVDGFGAAAFLRELKEAVEDPRGYVDLMTEGGS